MPKVPGIIGITVTKNPKAISYEKSIHYRKPLARTFSEAAQMTEERLSGNTRFPTLEQKRVYGTLPFPEGSRLNPIKKDKK